MYIQLSDHEEAVIIRDYIDRLTELQHPETAFPYQPAPIQAPDLWVLHKTAIMEIEGGFYIGVDADSQGHYNMAVSSGRISEIMTQAWQTRFEYLMDNGTASLPEPPM